MTVFNIEDIKENVVNVLRQNFDMSNNRGTFEATIDPSNYGTIAQSFIPFSTVFREDTRESFPIDIMVRKVGTPSDLKISVWSTDGTHPNQVLSGTEATIPVGTIPASFGTFSRAWVNLSNYSNKYLGSNTSYWIVVQPDGTVGVSDYYEFQRDNIDSNFWFGTGAQFSGGSWDLTGYNFRFQTSFPTWIYSNYPKVDLNIRNYPRIAVDLVGRPRVRMPWISHKLAKYEIDLAVILYSRSAEELSDLLAYQDRILFKNRINIPGVVEILPANFTNASIPRTGLFARTGMHKVRFHMVADAYPE